MSSTSQSPADRPPVAPTRRRTPRDTTRMVVAVVIGALLAAFALLNLDEVKVTWIFGTARTPLIVVIIVSLALGGVAGALLARSRRNPRRPS